MTKDKIVARSLYALRMSKSGTDGKMLSRQAVAASIGIAPQTLANWEHGSHNVSIEYAKKLADYYGVSLDELAGRTVTG